MKKKPPIVSVILCNYNYGKYIEETINSVLNQTFQNFELIIIDDGSTDNSRDIIANYHRAYPEKIKPQFKSNGGQASAFNAGFYCSVGDIICFLDSDDLWVPEKLSTIVEIYESSGNKYSLIQHPHKVINAESETNGNIHPDNLVSGDILDKYLTENHTNFFSTTSGLCIKRKYLEKIFPIDESWKICADVPISRAMPLFGEILSLNELLGLYRIHDRNNWTGSDAQAQWIKNQIKYNEFVNSKLKEFNINGKLDIKKSAEYRTMRIKTANKWFLKIIYQLDLLFSKFYLEFKRRNILTIIYSKMDGLKIGLVITGIFFFYGFSSLPGNLLIAFLTPLPFFWAWRKRAITTIRNQQKKILDASQLAKEKLKNSTQQYQLLYIPGFSTIEEFTDQHFRMLWYLNPVHANINRIFLPVYFDPRLNIDHPHYVDSKIKQFEKNFVDKFIFFDANNLEIWQILTSKKPIIMKWKNDVSSYNHKLQIWIQNSLNSRPIYSIDQKSEQYAASHYLMLGHDINPDYNQDFEESKKKLRELIDNLGKYERAYVFGTGPSLDQALDFDFSDGLTIACNSMVKYDGLMEHINPSLLVFADPVFHSGCSIYAGKFRQYLCRAIEKYNLTAIIPFRDYKLFKENIPRKYIDNIIGIPLKNLPKVNLNLRDTFAVKSTNNILTIFLLPIACSFADKVYICGCDGRKLEANDYFWRHNHKSQFNSEMNDAKRVNPSFFSKIDYMAYYIEHCDTLASWIEAGERIGKTFYNLTPSHIPALKKRYIQNNVEK